MCLADAPPAHNADGAKIVCDGGTINGGTCACPAGFKLMATGDGVAGGACVKTDAENCQGGELTVAGTCRCNGQVVMSGDTYLLEHVGGKCLPKRCPVQTELKDGRCVSLSALPAPGPEPDEARPASPKKASDGGDHRHRCGHGMVRTHAGCVAMRRRLPILNGNGFGGYYRPY